MANEQTGGALRAITANGWESGPQGQQVVGTIGALGGGEQYEAGAGPYLTLDIGTQFSIDAFGGGEEADLNIRSLFTGQAHGGNNEVVVDIRPTLTGFAYGGSDELVAEIRTKFTGYASGFPSPQEMIGAIAPTQFAITGYGGLNSFNQAPIPFITASGTVTTLGRLDLNVGFGGHPVPITGTATGQSGSLIFTEPNDIRTQFSFEGNFGGQLDANNLEFTLFSSSDSSGTAGNIGSLDRTQSYQFSITASGTQGAVGTAILTVPPFTSISPSSLVTTISLLSGFASGQPSGADTYKAWVSNAKSGALTEFDHWTFRHIVKFFGNYYGVNSSGIFLIGGADADGAAFNPSIEVAGIDFGVRALKRLVHLHATQRVPGKLQITTTPDEGTGILYELDGVAATGINRRRKKLMRGPRAEYWSVRIDGLDGEAMDLDTLELRAQIIEGRRL